MTKKQFENKYAGKVVHCDTEEKAKELLALALKYGWSLFGNKEIIEITYWLSYKENTCYRIDYDRTMGYCNLDFYKLQGWEVVEFESEKKKVKKTKKVFDLGLFVDWSIKNKRSRDTTLEDLKLWAWFCHGQTEEEMIKNGKQVADEWMKEVEIEDELSEKEIEILKALKVLGFNWIARNKNNYLYAYDYNPPKIDSYHGKTDNHTMLEEDLFSFISWKDEEPTSIEELLKYA